MSLFSPSDANQPANDDDLRGLSQLTRVRHLRIQGPDCSDATLSLLARMPDLWNVELGELPRVTDVGLGGLAHARRLARLALWEMPVGDDGIARLNLADKPDLCDVELIGLRVGDRGLTSLAGLPALVSVKLTGLAIGDDGLIALGNAGRVRFAVVTNSPVGNRGVRALYNSPNLELLRLESLPISDPALIGIGRATELSYLTVDCDQITGATFNELAGLDHLEEAAFGTNLTDAGMARLPPLKALASARLGGRDLTAAGVQRLGRCASLRYVSLRGMTPAAQDAAAALLKRALPGLIVQ